MLSLFFNQKGVYKFIFKEEENKIKEIVLKNPKIYHIDALRSRIVANYIFLEIEVTIKEEMSLKEAHDVIEEVRLLKASI